MFNIHGTAERAKVRNMDWMPAKFGHWKCQISTKRRCELKIRFSPTTTLNCKVRRGRGGQRDAFSIFFFCHKCAGLQSGTFSHMMRYNQSNILGWNVYVHPRNIHVQPFEGLYHDHVTMLQRAQESAVWMAKKLDEFGQFTNMLTYLFYQFTY